ncbi:MAG TPA: DUF4296 domain-containing protein [Flavobacterium sp.]|nr:DUF4296 domain-containing protein [Flavobacterium sp.]
MKKVLFFLSVLFLGISCGKTAVTKPDKLIDKETMTKIIYDLSVMEAMKSRNPGSNENNVSPDYIYKKYSIDSLQFAQNSQYYAADIGQYKEIYDKVAERMDKERKAADSIAKVKGEKVVPTNTSSNEQRIE